MVVAIRRAFAIPAIWFVTGGLSCCFAGKETAISTSDPVVYDVRMTTTLKIPGATKVERLEVKHALPNRRTWSLFTGGAGATDIQFSSGGRMESVADGEAHHIRWETRDRLRSGEVHRFLSQFQIRSVQRVLLPGRAGNSWEEIGAIPATFKLSSEGGRDTTHPTLKKRAELIRKGTSPYDAIIEFSKWIENYMQDDASVNFTTSNVKAIMIQQAGHSGHRAKLFSELCGVVGIPVRTIWGFNLQEEDGRDSLHRIRADYTNSYTWVEVYLPGAGWVEVDPGGEGNPFSIPPNFIRNNSEFPNYSILVRANGKERQPEWVTREKGGFSSDFGVEHIVEFRATAE